MREFEQVSKAVILLLLDDLLFLLRKSLLLVRNEVAETPDEIILLNATQGTVSFARSAFWETYI